MANGRRFDICTPRPNRSASAQQGQIWWFKIGSAFENDRGMIVGEIHCHPLPNEEGQIKIGIFPQSDENRGGSSSGPARASSGGSKGKSAKSNDDDEIPF